MPEEEAALCNNPEVLSRLGNELDHTPEPCGKIIRLFYYTDATMEDIAEETGLKTPRPPRRRRASA